MSRLLSEKRIITVDTTSENPNTFDVGACVIDSTNEAIYVSDGASWTEIQLGSDIAVTYEALNASGAIDTSLSNGATASTVPSSSAVKSYVDGEIGDIPTPIPTRGGYIYADGNDIGKTNGHEIGLISGNCNIVVAGVVQANYYHTVYNYSNNTYTITSNAGAVLVDAAAGKGAGQSVQILGAQKMVFIKEHSGDDIIVYRESI